jgi:hypothetical protein
VCFPEGFKLRQAERSGGFLLSIICASQQEERIPNLLSSQEIGKNRFWIKAAENLTHRG